jgi:hypothetical protein
MTGLIMKYFVLKPRGNDIYALASRKAMKIYANTIRKENVIFAHDIDVWVKQEEYGVKKENGT